MALPNTHHGPKEIAEILKNKKKIFFDGIGGVSMNSLAHISHLRGYEVSGYDRTESAITDKLEAMGIKVYYTASAEHVKDCAALVYTVAIPESNPEYSYARDHGIPLISRADYLGYIMTGYSERIGVSGTHGKSTTTGMLAKILSYAKKNPTVSGGAALKETGEVDIIGGHDYFVFEACEYMDSFLDFNPTTAIILNIELDHVDYFKSMEQMRGSYLNFITLPSCKNAVINLDDENCRLVAAEAVKRGINVVSFSRTDKSADYYSENEDTSDGYPEFDIMSKGEKLAHVKLKIPGAHYISDSLAAFAACIISGTTPEEIAGGLSEYRGICRRMEYLGKTKNGAELYSDYAHHPTEIAATLSAARKITKGRLIIVFQSHTYSRTAELFDGFVSAFADSGVDKLILCPIYAARETNTYGITSEKLAGAICEKNKSVVCADSLEKAAEIAEAEGKDGDVIVVMGAGDVIKVAEILEGNAK